MSQELDCFLYEVLIPPRDYKEMKRNLTELLYEYLQRGENNKILNNANTSDNHPQMDTQEVDSE